MACEIRWSCLEFQYCAMSQGPATIVDRLHVAFGLQYALILRVLPVKRFHLPALLHPLAFPVEEGFPMQDLALSLELESSRLEHLARSRRVASLVRCIHGRGNAGFAGCLGSMSICA